MFRSSTLLGALLLLSVFVLSVIASPYSHLPTTKTDKYNLRTSKAFLASKSKTPGAITLPSGLVFDVLQRGTGDRAPTVEETCEVHYTGTLRDGTVFDSSRERGEAAKFRPNQVIPAWTEALQMMREGDRWRIYVPQELGYGARGAGAKIPPFSALVFDMELIRIEGGGKGRTVEEIEKLIEAATKTPNEGEL